MQSFRRTIITGAMALLASSTAGQRAWAGDADRAPLNIQDIYTVVLDAGTVFLVLALVGCVYTLAAAALFALRLKPRDVPSTAMAVRPSVTILKPLHGDEPCLYRNLKSFVAQDYPAPVEVIFGVGDIGDPAARVVERLQAEYPDKALVLVVDARRRGRNGKVSNLINMAEHACHDLIVLADSDMLVEPDYLRHLAAEMGRPGVGLVTCLYRGMGLPTLWSTLATQWIDYHFLPSVVVGMALGMAKPCFGSTIAMRRDTLDAIGGFAAFKDQLADDYAMGEAVRALGLKVAVPEKLVLGHLCASASPSDLARHELRWARTIRSVDPSGFIGSVVTQPVPLATIALLASGFSGPAAAVLWMSVASRLLLQLIVSAFVGRRPTGLILGPLRDYATFLIFIASLWPGSIDWRGHRFALRADGTLAPPDIAGT